MILLIILSVSMGFAFSRLAHDYHKTTWPIAILGGGVFLAGTILFSIIITIIMLSSNTIMDTGISLIGSVIAYALSGVVCLIIYRFLKKKWEAEQPIGGKKQDNSDLLDR